jgi:competence protein ComEC
MSDDRFDDFEEKAKEVDPFEPEHSTTGWVVIATLVLIAGGLWFYAGPTYLKKYVSPPPQASSQDSSDSGSVFGSPSGDGTIPGREPDEMAVVFLNVKYGDGILVQAPDNTTSLIDGGEGGNPDSEQVPAYDWAYELYFPLFEEVGITRIEHLISTVPLSHHMGVHADLIANDKLTVNTLHRTGYPASFYSFRRAKLEARNHDVPVKTMNSGDRIDFGSGVKSQVVFGDDGEKLAPASSHVLSLKYGDISFLLMSDLPSRKEAEMVLEWSDALESDVLKVGDHGNRESTSMELLRYVKPDHAVISVSRRNPLNAPHEETLQRLNKAGINTRQIFRTDTDGHIGFFTDGNTIRVETGILSSL